MEIKDDIAYLQLMRDAFRKIRLYTSSVDFESFMANEEKQSAVIMQLAVVGELVKKVPQSMREEIDLPWKQMIGMRDWVAHDYFSLELPQVWETATVSVPEAEEKIVAYLAAHPL